MHDTINIYPLKNAWSRSNTYLKNEHRYLAHCPYSLWQASSTIAASIFSASKEMKNWRFIFERQSDKVSTGRQSYRTKINHQSCRTKRKYQYNVCAQIYFLILLVVTPSTWWHFYALWAVKWSLGWFTAGGTLFKSFIKNSAYQ